MTAVQEPPTHCPGTGAGGFLRVDLLLAQIAVQDAAHEDLSGCTETQLVDQVRQIESLQASLAALQATRVRAFARAHVENRLADAGTAGDGADPGKLHRSVVAQVQLACRIPTGEARARVANARDLHDGLHHVRELHVVGELSAAKVAAVTVECRGLTGAQRAAVDARLAAHRDLARLGIGRLRALTRRLVAELVPDRFRARVHAARAERRVTLRPAPDAMSYLTAYVPVEQGAACLAALQKAFTELSVSPEPLTRTRGQVAADTLVERVTGQRSATAVDLEVQVTVPVQALLDPGSPLPAEIPGLGPVPVELLAASDGATSVRRLLTDQGVVIGGDSRKRTFTGLLATLVRARAGHRCTEPYCDAPVRHLDHIERAADGGPTTLENGRGVCEFHNHVREQPGWHVARAPDGTVATTTPTGHTYYGPGPPASDEFRKRHRSPLT
ncbi:hypothetical protein Ae717Ps2_3589 [Pseudonocardia sp. Ae717_Ps2]|uniref:DUF222 domain-containing protein n=1 Tax=Pseudonocardia sp. Ae717_Ps2 TaxID=1885573 RepID=UPI00094B74C7|nr:DUF222 domain-containing protein [Pseudonocardia sp. Ae717_Ps2]OLM32693.1 hypothetical protein Ae717Ps2_3589 [Pseudonocardia sp. Ae717_Ps2]